MALFDAHLKLGDIKGESKHKDHKEEVELLSFSLGGNQTGTSAHGGGSGAGKVAMHDVHVVARLDKASVHLFHAMCSGKHFPEGGKITCRKAGGQQEKFLEVEVKDVLVSGFQFGGSPGSDTIPTIQFSLNVGTCSMEYFEQDASGKTTSAGKKTVNIKEMKFA